MRRHINYGEMGRSPSFNELSLAVNKLYAAYLIFENEIGDSFGEDFSQKEIDSFNDLSIQLHEASFKMKRFIKIRD